MIYFSVIIPLYNKEKYVENTLKSILNQSYTSFEVLIINDCSTDSSVEKVIPFLSDKIKLIHHARNKGLSAARNTGIQNATANYITFLDADDIWKPHFLETIHHLTKSFSEAQIFATNYEELYDSKVVVPQNGTNHLSKNSSGILNFFKTNLQQGIYNHGSVCFHKLVYETIGYYDETIDFAEDIDFNIRANAAFSLAYSNTVGMSYRMQTQHQLTSLSICNKSLPNFDQYDYLSSTNSDIKKYLDFERYVLSKHLIMDGASLRAKKISQSIDLKNLTWKQQLLLKMPLTWIKIISKVKLFLVKKGLKVSSY